MEERSYLCIDLKSFYASVECVERGLDPMTANLAVADPNRGERTLCLAISPSMKALGIKNRCRVFQIPEGTDYVMAPPRMKRYIEYSAEIYAIYLKYIAKEDIHVYSIDEAFFDVTDYLSMYQMGARELAVQMMLDVRAHTGIPAAAGIGTNLYLAKIALDITAKHVEDNIGVLNEARYRETLWRHQPLTDFWRIGEGTVKRLRGMGLRTMEDVAHANEDMLYRMFGIDAELLIDHAWGRESTTMEDIKAYRPAGSSLSSGQVLSRDYSFEECRLVVKEMTDALCLDMADRGLVTESMTLTVSYAYETGLKQEGGTAAMTVCTNTYRAIIPHIMELYERIVKRDAPIRKITLTANRLKEEGYEQYDLFSDFAEIEREKKLQRAVLAVKKKYGKNALVRGMDLQEAATALERNRQIGGHSSGEQQMRTDNSGVQKNGAKNGGGQQVRESQRRAQHKKVF